MNRYRSNVSGNLFEASDDIGDKLWYQIYLVALEGKYNNYSMNITPSDLALGFTKVGEVESDGWRCDICNDPRPTNVVSLKKIDLDQLSREYR